MYVMAFEKEQCGTNGLNGDHSSIAKRSGSSSFSHNKICLSIDIPWQGVTKRLSHSPGLVKHSVGLQCSVVVVSLNDKPVSFCLEDSA